MKSDTAETEVIRRGVKFEMAVVTQAYALRQFSLEFLM